MEFETKDEIRLVAEMIECEAVVLMAALDAMRHGPNDARTYERALWSVEWKLRTLAEKLKAITASSPQRGAE